MLTLMDPRLLFIIVGCFVHSDAGCESWEFSCRNHECVRNTARCNGYSECSDASDELGCPWSSGSSTTDGAKGHCTKDQFHCRNNRCVWNAWRCDQQNDCGDGSDEMGCTTEDRDSPPPVSASAVIGISVAVICVLCVLVTVVGIWCYHKRKQQRHATSYPGPASLSDLPPGLSYNLPREALLREPPPRYTSTDNLAIVNPSYRDDDAVLPPPYYTSSSAAAPYAGLGPPPSYCSRTDLRNHQLVEDDGPAAYSRYNGQASRDLAVISNGMLRPVDGLHVSSLSHSGDSMLVDQLSVLPAHPPITRDSSPATNTSGMKPQPSTKNGVSTSTVLKDSSCSLDGSKSSVVEEKSLSYSVHDDSGKLTDAPPPAPPLRQAVNTELKTQTDDLKESKDKARSTPCLGTQPGSFSISPGQGVDGEPQPDDAVLSTAGSAPVVPGRRLAQPPDLARWGAQILACSSRRHLDESTFSIPASQEATMEGTSLDSSVSRCSSSVRPSGEDHGVNARYNKKKGHVKTSSKPKSSISKNSSVSQACDRAGVSSAQAAEASAMRTNKSTLSEVATATSVHDVRLHGRDATAAAPGGQMQKAHSLPQLSYSTAQGSGLRLGLDDLDGFYC